MSLNDELLEIAFLKLERLAEKVSAIDGIGRRRGNPHWKT
jgi:hypothetical protein